VRLSSPVSCSRATAIRGLSERSGTTLTLWRALVTWPLRWRRWRLMTRSSSVSPGPARQGFHQQMNLPCCAADPGQHRRVVRSRTDSSGMPAASASRIAMTVCRSTRSIGRPIPRSETSDIVATSSENGRAEPLPVDSSRLNRARIRVRSDGLLFRPPEAGDLAFSGLAFSAPPRPGIGELFSQCSPTRGPVWPCPGPTSDWLEKSPGRHRTGTPHRNGDEPRDEQSSNS
jgi:hypothetical protein